MRKAAYEPLKKDQVCPAYAEHKREGRENRLRSRHCERRALRVRASDVVLAGATAPALTAHWKVSPEAGREG